MDASNALFGATIDERLDLNHRLATKDIEGGKVTQRVADQSVVKGEGRLVLPW